MLILRYAAAPNSLCSSDMTKALGTRIAQICSGCRFNVVPRDLRLVHFAEAGTGSDYVHEAITGLTADNRAHTVHIRKRDAHR